MKSPIYHAQFMGVHLDLSKLVEVGPAEFLDRTPDHEWLVGFSYRYSDGVGPLYWHRELKKEPVDQDLVQRNWDHEQRGEPMEGPDEIEAGKAGFEMRDLFGSQIGERGAKLFRNEDRVLYCVANLQRQIDELIEAWIRWKAIEPEVYAIIRKHLQA